MKVGYREAGTEEIFHLLLAYKFHLGRSLVLCFLHDLNTLLSPVSLCMHAKPLQLCPTLSDPMDYSPPGSSVHGILQAKIQEWVAMPSSKWSTRARDRTCVSCLLHWRSGSLPPAPPGKHVVIISSKRESGLFLWGFSTGLSQQTMIPDHLGKKKKKWFTQCRCFICWAKGLGNREIIHFKMSLSVYVLF